MNNNYNDMAAKWWADTIQHNQLEPIKILDFFRKELSSKIKSFTSINGSMVISTYGSPSKLLNEIAFRSGLDAKIPSGYEMRILFDNVSVYNSIGKLVASF